MHSYKAIIFDLDGTAVANRLEAMPSPALIQAVKQAKPTLHLIAASGRTADTGLPILQALGLTDPCVLDGGATIIDPLTGQAAHQAHFTQAQLDAITAVCRPYPYRIRADHEAFTAGATASQRQLTGPITILFIISVPTNNLALVINALSDIPGVRATSARSYNTDDHVLNVTTSDGTKEHGVKRVLEHLGIERADTIGVGDGDNDIHLFAATGHHIAMGNASDQLKTIADEIAPSVDEDGLAWVIKNFYKQQS